MSKVIADCTMCGNHKEVVEFIKNIDGRQQVIHICNECGLWLEEVVTEACMINCQECANYNVGDGVDNIEECYGCKYHFK